MKFPYLRPEKGNNTGNNKPEEITGNTGNSLDKEALMAYHYQTPERDLDIASDNKDFFIYITSHMPVNNKTFLLDSGTTTHIISNKALFKGRVTRTPNSFADTPSFRLHVHPKFVYTYTLFLRV